MGNINRIKQHVQSVGGKITHEYDDSVSRFRCVSLIPLVSTVHAGQGLRLAYSSGIARHPDDLDTFGQSGEGYMGSEGAHGTMQYGRSL